MNLFTFRNCSSRIGIFRWSLCGASHYIVNRFCLTFSSTLIVLLLINSQELKRKKDAYEKCYTVGWNLCRVCPAQISKNEVKRKTHRASRFLCGWLIDESIEAEFGCNASRIGVRARWRLLNTSGIERLWCEEGIRWSWNWSRLTVNTIERQGIRLDICEVILTVLCGVLCIVSNVQSATCTPITSRSRKIILCFRKWQCFCVHPPVSRLWIWIVTGLAEARVLGKLTVVGAEIVLLVLQMTDVGFDEP